VRVLPYGQFSRSPLVQLAVFEPVAVGRREAVGAELFGLADSIALQEVHACKLISYVFDDERPLVIEMDVYEFFFRYKKPKLFLPVINLLLELALQATCRVHHAFQGALVQSESRGIPVIWILTFLLHSDSLRSLGGVIA